MEALEFFTPNQGMAKSQLVGKCEGRFRGRAKRAMRFLISRRYCTVKSTSNASLLLARVQELETGDDCTIPAELIYYPRLTLDSRSLALRPTAWHRVIRA